MKALYLEATRVGLDRGKIHLKSKWGDVSLSVYGDTWAGIHMEVVMAVVTIDECLLYGAFGERK